jgi:hypothetical protein
MNPTINLSRRVYALRHIETSEYICLRQDNREYMACFTDGDGATQFREELGLVEFVDVSQVRLEDAPFNYFWLDGEMLNRSVLTDVAHSK